MGCIIYGAGKKGLMIYNFLKSQGIGDEIIAFSDIKADKIQSIDGVEVLSYEDAVKRKTPIVFSIENEIIRNEVKNRFIRDGAIVYDDIYEWLSFELGYNKSDIYRLKCAYTHIDADSYYKLAEEESYMNFFWGNESVFYSMFKKMDISRVVELACGRGRHVPFYADIAQEVTIVDILKENIDYCKERFSDRENIRYYHNNGRDLKNLQSDSYTALFTYDAMVHFEMIDIYFYLKETYRILKKGGYALFHHSNDDSDYKNWFGEATNGHNRSFMSDRIFAHLAYRNGFEIVEQEKIDWGGKSELDCITLVKKPE